MGMGVRRMYGKKIIYRNILNIKKLTVMKIRIKRLFIVVLCLGLTAASNYALAQPAFTALAATGYNQDVIAESGNGALSATTSPVDGSNNVLYSKNFATVNNLQQYSWVPMGGLPDNGKVSTGRYNFQLASYSGNNALLLTDLTGSVPGAVKSGTLTLTTPTVFTWLSVLAFSTEGSSTLTVTFNFADGSSATSPNQTLNDWYGSGTVVIGGMGRTPMTSPTLPGTGNDTYSYQTHAYGWNIMVPCASQGKTVKSVTFNYIGGGNGTHPALVLGLASYGAYTIPDFTTAMLPSRCGNNNWTLSVTNQGGGTSPFKYSWSTTPGQTTNIIAGLSAGSYTCTVTDSNGCTFPFSGTVTKVVAGTLTAAASPASVCEGSSTTLTVSSSSSNPSLFTWTPNSQTGNSVTVSPTATTTYTVTGKDFYGCTSSTTVAVTVNAIPAASFSVNPQPSCTNTAQTVTFTGSAGSGATHNRNNFAGAVVQSGSGAGPYIIEYGQPGTYNGQLEVTDKGCSSTYTGPVTVEGTSVVPVVTVLAATSRSVTFGWQPVPGATGYQVSVNAGPYIDPSSGGTGPTHTFAGLHPQQTVNIMVIAL